MNYPKELSRPVEKVYDESRIKSWHRMYIRHKPSTDWVEEESLPDFSRIKIDQSMFWCCWSIPAWARFNPDRDYLNDYAIVSYSVWTFRNSHKLDSILSQGVCSVIHKPVENNYSHCELKLEKELNKPMRRALRMTFKHRCKVCLKPFQRQNPLISFFHRFRMYFYRLVLKLDFSLSSNG